MSTKINQRQVRDLDNKESIIVTTTENGTLSTAYANGQTVNGVVLATGDRILIKDQTNGSENGIYKVPANGAPARAEDMPIGEKVAGVKVTTEEGTVNKDKTFLCTNDDGSDVVGTDNLVFILDSNVTSGTTTNAILRWNGSNWIEVTSVALLSTGELGIGSGVLNPTNKVEIQGTTNDNSLAALDIKKNNLDSILFVRNDGKVGIGTSSPTDFLHVAVTGAAEGFKFERTGGVSGSIALSVNSGPYTESHGRGVVFLVVSIEDFSIYAHTI